MSGRSMSEILDVSTKRCREMDAPLAERLQALADDVRDLSAEFADIVDRMVQRLKASGAGEHAPGPGDMMPSFVLPDQEGHLVSLDQMLNAGPVVISFHRGHWCPYCRINADALAKIEPEITAKGGQIVVITPEMEQFTSEMRTDANAKFPILSDLDNGYALELGLTISIDDEKRNAMTAAGWDIAQFHGNNGWMLPIPATFVVNSDGAVVARFVDPDYRKRMDTDQILAALSGK